MSSFMDVESENIAPYQPRFIPERGSGSVNRPLGSISANASNVGINNNSSMLQASKPFYGRESALGTPSRVGASFCDSMMAEFSPMAINRSSIMPSAYTPTSSVPHRNHAPSMALEPMAVSPMFTALTPTATAKTPMMQGRTCMGRAATPKPSLSLLSQVCTPGQHKAWEQHTSLFPLPHNLPIHRRPDATPSAGGECRGVADG